MRAQTVLPEECGARGRTAEWDGAGSGLPVPAWRGEGPLSRNGEAFAGTAESRKATEAPYLRKVRLRPLKIFISHPSHYLTDSEPHGDGLLAYEYISRLAARGHTIDVAVPAMSLQNPLPLNVRLHPVRLHAPVSKDDPPILHRFEYAVRVRSLLRRLQRNRGFDLIHQLNPVVRGMSSLLHGSGLPIVLGPLPAPGSLPLRTDSGSRLNRAVLHAQIRRAARVLVPNAASLPLVPKDALSRAKVRELHFGVDTRIFRPLEEKADAGRNILFLANLYQHKGAALLLEAFERIADRHPDCTLRIAGSGPEEAALKQLAAGSRASGRILFLGKVRREDVPQVLNTATVYCLPSLYEAFGMTALEAMACGKPVVATDVGGLGILVSGSSPRVPPGDAGALAAALDRFLSSPELCATTGENNRQTVADEYDWERVIDCLEAIYGELLQI